MKTDLISFRAKPMLQAAAGLFGGTVLGIALFLAMMNVGANHGCLKLLDRIFKTAGYESCGSFGAIVGVFAGVLLGVFAVRNWSAANPSQAAARFALGAFVLPVLYGVITFFPQFLGGDVFGTLRVILFPVFAFMIVSSLLSLLITWIVNRRSAG